MSNVKKVQFEVEVNQIIKPFVSSYYAYDYRKALVKELNLGSLLSMIFMCLDAMNRLYMKQCEYYKQREIMATFDQKSSAGWIKACATKKLKSELRRKKVQEIIKLVGELENI